ncbi:MAG: hypothetical protein GY801_50235 [bacterium]|nr:hypothetical protein [bacterium]
MCGWTLVAQGFQRGDIVPRIARRAKGRLLAMLDKDVLRKHVEEIERLRGELILSKYRYEESQEDFDKLFGKGSSARAIHALRSRALLKKLVLTHEALDSVTEELYDDLTEEGGGTGKKKEKT